MTKQFIEEKTNEYNNYKKRLEELKEEVENLYKEQRIKTAEYEKARNELAKVVNDLSHDQEFMDNLMVNYVNKTDLKNVLKSIGITYGAVSLFALISLLSLNINIQDIGHFVNSFIVLPGSVSIIPAVVSSLTSDKRREKYTRKFHELEETKKIQEKIDEKQEVKKNKQKVHDEKRDDMKSGRYHIEQVEYKIQSVRHAMDKIKTEIVEVICNEEYPSQESQMILSKRR